MNNLENLCVNVATTGVLGNITFPDPPNSYLKFIYTDSNPLVIDSKTIEFGDIVLLKDQTNKIFNGIYDCVDISGDEYTFIRNNSGLFLNDSSNVFVKEGLVNLNKTFIFSPQSNPFTVGVTNLEYIESKGGVGANLNGILVGNGVNPVVAKKSEFSETVNPTVNDDESLGYDIGSRWINTVLDKEFVCLDNTLSAAVWIETTQSGGGGGGGSLSCVAVPVIGLVPSGSLRYCQFASPVDLVGSKASTVTVSSGTPLGDQIVSTDAIFRVDVQLGLQYSSQPGGNPRRTFVNIDVNGSTVNSNAAGVPASTNNWRSERTLSWFGLSGSDVLQIIVNTNTIGTTTLNNGIIFLTFQT